jgi:hypothetical protein
MDKDEIFRLLSNRKHYNEIKKWLKNNFKCEYEITKVVIRNNVAKYNNSTERRLDVTLIVDAGGYAEIELITVPEYSLLSFNIDFIDYLPELLRMLSSLDRKRKINLID